SDDPATRSSSVARWFEVKAGTAQIVAKVWVRAIRVRIFRLVMLTRKTKTNVCTQTPPPNVAKEVENPAGQYLTKAKTAARFGLAFLCARSALRKGCPSPSVAR